MTDRYGPPDVVRVEEVPDPTPGADEVLVRVRAAAVTSADSRIRGARFPPGFGPFARLAFGVRRPRRPILGGTFSGEIAAVGAKVERLAPGDRVCGMTGVRMGAHAEFLRVAAKKVVGVPDGLDHDRAAGVLFGGTTALHFLDDRAALGPGTEVLVNGASGAIGTNAVQLAHLAGATVTAVTRAANAGLAERLGAERTIDHTQVDVTALRDRYDVVLDTVGNLTIRSGRPLLREGGVLLLAVAGLADMVRARGDVRAGTSPEKPEAFTRLVDLVADGSLEVIVERTFGLDGIVDAHRLVDSGRKVGNMIVHP